MAMEDYLDIKQEIVSLKKRVKNLEEKLKHRKRIRTCPCKERETGKCNVYAGYECPFDLLEIEEGDND